MFIRSAIRVDGFVAFARGTPTVYPSAQVNATQSAGSWTPACARRFARGIPSQRAVLTRFPPTSLLTHSSVTISSRESVRADSSGRVSVSRSEEHTSELQSRLHLVCRLLLEKKKKQT